MSCAPPYGRTSMTTTGTYAPVNGLQLYYESYGTGRPLVLLHGGLLTIELRFALMLSSLAECHQVIAVERQGTTHMGVTRSPDQVLALVEPFLAG